MDIKPCNKVVQQSPRFPELLIDPKPAPKAPQRPLPKDVSPPQHVPRPDSRQKQEPPKRPESSRYDEQRKELELLKEKGKQQLRAVHVEEVKINMKPLRPQIARAPSVQEI